MLLQFNCWVLGEDPSHIFTIEIEHTKTASVLRKAIKDEKKITFQHVDADALVLRKVYLPIDNHLKENVENAVYESLSPVDELSDIFPDPLAKKHLHIVVKAPPAGEF
jgi:Crinkler effector protein N-terminal domain